MKSPGTGTIPKVVMKNANIIKTNLLTKFHEDRKINMASRVLTRKNAQPPGSHVFQTTGINFELVQDIIWMNLLTKFHEDRTVNVASRVLTRLYYSHIRKIAPPLGSHVFQANQGPANIIIFQLIQDTCIIETNLLTKFHEDWTINEASRVLTRQNAPPPGGHVFKATKTIFELIQDISGKNLLTKFHDDRKINVTSRVLTRKNAPPLGSHVFQSNVTILEHIRNIKKTNLLTKFHEDWTINKASRVLTRFFNQLESFLKNVPRYYWDVTRFYYSHIRAPDKERPKKLQSVQKHAFNILYAKKNGPLLGSHVFQSKVTIFELIQDIIGTNLLSKFHEDRKINVVSRVLTSKNAPPPDGHVFQPTSIIFELIQDIIGMNLLTTFHEDQTINLALEKNALPLGSHVFQANVTIFELIQDMIETNLLTKFHEDWTINVPSRELTRQMLTPHNAQRTKGEHKSSP
ncbi:hypothetical protein DPMN_182987 [Dreissena polymorpha]|uniref:Uncharacterized protein n=1 Tax=Dreissena polymorpha TaxID=45954 RepID=A0A9D4I375_DREPO|nr:hypothetical protein DPMN_182987 [Dreissena polymorpha]